MGDFGRSFEKLAEARAYLKKQKEKGDHYTGSEGFRIRKLDKKLFPRRKKLYHVGSEIDFLNFA
jgi:hypothetical protein